MCIVRAPLPRRRRNPRPLQTARHGRLRRPWTRKRTTYIDACHALWAVHVMGWTQTATANVLRLNQGVVSCIVRGLRFRNAYPIPIAGFGGEALAAQRQGELPF